MSYVTTDITTLVLRLSSNDFADLYAVCLSTDLPAFRALAEKMEDHMVQHAHTKTPPDGAIAFDFPDALKTMKERF